MWPLREADWGGDRGGQKERLGPQHPSQSAGRVSTMQIRLSKGAGCLPAVMADLQSEGSERPRRCVTLPLQGDFTRGR